MNYRTIFLLIAGFLFISLAYADVPKQINFQGRLTDSAGKFVPDGNYSITFRIYTDSTGGSSKWQEAQLVSVSKGLFNVILGSINSIPDSIFNYTDTWLGIQVGLDPEMSPRQRLSSLGYSYRTTKADTSSYSMNSDKLDGYDATYFTSTGADYGRFNVASNLYEGSTALVNKYVNSQGPDSVYSTSNFGFKGKVSGSSSSTLIGTQGYAENSSTGAARGVYGYGKSSSSGWVHGGLFSTSSEGTGVHRGIEAQAYASSSTSTIGSYNYASNSSDGDAYAGYFYTSSSGTGTHYGLRAYSFGSSDSSTYGIYSYGSNSSMGDVYGGYFEASSFGTGGNPFGLRVVSSSNTSWAAYGIICDGENSSSGSVYSGIFNISPSGTGLRTGVSTNIQANSSSSVTGYNAQMYNSSSGNVYGGRFWLAGGIGTRYGIYTYVPESDGYAGYFSGNVYVDDTLVVSGSKSASVKIDNGEYRLLYSQESPEIWFEDFGEGQLVNGRAHIELDPVFLQTVTINGQHPIKVFVQLTSGNPMNVVVNKGTNGFDVLAEDNTSSATFDYRVVAKRKGYEHIRLAKLGGPTPEEVAAEQEEYNIRVEQDMAELESKKDSMEKEELPLELGNLKLD